MASWVGCQRAGMAAIDIFYARIRAEVINFIGRQNYQLGFLPQYGQCRDFLGIFSLSLHNGQVTKP